MTASRNSLAAQNNAFVVGPWAIEELERRSAIIAALEANKAALVDLVSSIRDDIQFSVFEKNIAIRKRIDAALATTSDKDGL